MPRLRQLTALTLACVTLMAGATRPVAASADEISGPSHVLTIDGQPLWHGLHSTNGSDAWLLSPLRVQESGQIAGVAVDGQGRPLPYHEAKLRSASAPQTSPLEIARTMETNAHGRFSFSAVTDGVYLVEILSGGKVVATSDTLRVAAGRVTSVRITQAPSQAIAAPAPRKRGVAFWTAVGAGVGAGLGLLATTGADCDQPESLCPVAPMMGASAGALMGLLFGLGR